MRPDRHEAAQPEARREAASASSTATACTSSSGRTAASGGGSSTASTARRSRCRSAPTPKCRWRWRVPRDEARQLVAAGTDPSAVRKRSQGGQAASRRQHARGGVARLADAPAPGVDARHARRHHGVAREPRVPVARIAARSHEIPARDIRELVQAIDEQGAGETAGRVFQRLRSIYRYALSDELVEVDPTYALKPSEILKPRNVSHRLALSPSRHAGVPARARPLRRRSVHEGRAGAPDPHGRSAGRAARRSLERDR